MASSAQEALRKERKRPADDCWVDDDWEKGETKNLSNAIGFKYD